MSGDVVTAGHILLKHHQFTHRNYYLMSLRKSLPSTTPFFDIGIAYTTPHREKIPHLIVKCGSNHVTALTEALSQELDGKQSTALFLSSSLIKTMTTEEASGLFEIHRKFTASIQRLPLFPQVVNIDRPRTEINPNGVIITRSTREWAKGLKSESTGQSYQCDAENGGREKRAYLLVPTAFLTEVKQEYQKYKQSLHQMGPSAIHSQKSSNGQCSPDINECPHEIYVPTAAVKKNLLFLQTMSNESIWQSAPRTVRQPPTSQIGGPKLNAHAGPASVHGNGTNKVPQQQQNDQGRQYTALRTTVKKVSSARSPEAAHTFDEATTICTTQSPLTRNTQTPSISVLEDTIHKQQETIRAMALRFDAMDEKIASLTHAVKSGESTHNNTIINIQQQLNSVCHSLQILVEQSTSSKPTSASIEATTPIRHNQSLSSHQNPQFQDNPSPSLPQTSSPERFPSPEKKKQRPNTAEIINNCHTISTVHATPTESPDQCRAQYTSPRSTDGQTKK
jgi:hypothetical protein